ncbi:MAG: response regulator [Planctomycetales bacterium]
MADDDRELVHILRRRCQELGLQVTAANDGFHAACDMFLAGDEGDRFDLIILDVNMPADDGLSLCEEMLREPSLWDVPVIVLTGRTDSGTIRRCEELGASYVLKSGNFWPELEGLIRELLELPSPCGGTEPTGTGNASTRIG